MQGMPLSLAAALASAGGPTPEADLSKISVVRLAADGTRKVIPFDCSTLGRPGSGDLGPDLEPNDVVVVPRGDVFVLAGEVARPGAFTRKDLFLDAGEPARLSRVLLASGGLKPTASRKDLRLVRPRADGTKEVVAVDLDAALRGRSAAPARGPKDDPESPKADDPDPILRNGDILVAGGTGGVTILGKVRTPGVYGLAGESLKLSRVIALAGGFAEFAKTSSVIVVRASAPKQPVRVNVNAITSDGNLEQDIDLGDGDIVFVGERIL